MAHRSRGAPHPRPLDLPSQGRESSTFKWSFECLKGQTLEPLERDPLYGKQQKQEPLFLISTFVALVATGCWPGCPVQQLTQLLVWKGVSFLLWVVRSSGPRLLEPGFIRQDSKSGLLDIQPSGPECQTHIETAAAAPRPSAAHMGLNPETRMVSGLWKGPGREKGW